METEEQAWLDQRARSGPQSKSSSAPDCDNDDHYTTRFQRAVQLTGEIATESHGADIHKHLVLANSSDQLVVQTAAKAGSSALR
jgi:hypothetical protein